MAKVLRVSRSGYYKWLRRAPKQKEIDLIEQIKDLQLFHRFRYGSPRMTEELKTRGLVVGHNKVARIMRENGINARYSRKYFVTTDSAHGYHPEKNILNRDFRAKQINQKWTSDITYIRTREGWLYLCVVLDLFSRKVVGWNLSCNLDSELVRNALEFALNERNPPGGMIFHSDQGIQYFGKELKRLIAKYKIIQSMSRRGNCWDNAPAESFFRTLKVELIGDYRFRTRNEAMGGLKNYIDSYYNIIRIHSSLGYKTPEMFEQPAST